MEYKVEAIQETEEEMIELKLHQVTDYKTSHILTILYPKTVSFHGKQLWELIQQFLFANKLTISDVTIFYYYDSTINKLNEIHELIFDHYLDKYVGDRIEILLAKDSPHSVRDIHKKIMEELLNRGTLSKEEIITLSNGLHLFRSQNGEYSLASHKDAERLPLKMEDAELFLITEIKILQIMLEDAEKSTDKPKIIKKS